MYAYDAILYRSHYSHLQNRVETIRRHHNLLWFVVFFLAATTSHWRILFISSFELFMSLTRDFFKVYLIFLKIGCLNFVFFYGLKLNSKKKRWLNTIQMVMAYTETVYKSIFKSTFNYEFYVFQKRQ